MFKGGVVALYIHNKISNSINIVNKYKFLFCLRLAANSQSLLYIYVYFEISLKVTACQKILIFFHHIPL
jgi:hypothetical protein